MHAYASMREVFKARLNRKSVDRISLKMKKYQLASVKTVVIAIVAFLFFSCESVKLEDDAALQGNAVEKVPVNVSFSDFTVSFEDDGKATRSSDKNASEVGINRIALSVFDKNGTLVFSDSKNSSAELAESDQFDCELLPGDYTFVAVAHKTNDDSETAANITSSSQATITTSKVLKTFSASQAVTVKWGQTNSVVVDFGKFVNSLFQLQTTDETPSEVTSCEIILNPDASTSNTYTLDPSTGFVAEPYQHKVTFLCSATQGAFKNMVFGTYCFLTDNTENITVTVNMKDASDNIVKSHTFENVPMAPHRATRATGMFFHASVNGGFVFDAEEDAMVNIQF